jgi:hypothetical protein
MPTSIRVEKPRWPASSIAACVSSALVITTSTTSTNQHTVQIIAAEVANVHKVSQSNLILKQLVVKAQEGEQP